MEWKGKKLETYTEIISYALNLPKKEQKEFVAAFAKTGPYALQNIGYFSGYYDNKTADRILRVFQTAHPVFGRTHPTPEEALEMGKALSTGRSK